MLGQTLSHYRILEQIGAGGMGVVYRAQDEQLERDVAVKVLPPGTLGDENARSRFRKEALSLAKLNHPNIATVHEFGSHEGVDFLVTEFIQGDTLQDKLARGPLATREVIALGLQLTQGLAAAHGQGVVHRDIKPANLRLTLDGRLKILDFGLAQFVFPEGDLARTVSMTTSQQITGTLPYMAPEQLRGDPADPRTDIWAAGVVLYEMATGRRPFVESNGPLLINAILNQVPETPSKANPQLAPGLDVIILRALEKDPAKRYQTVAELQADLERLSAGVPVVARREPWAWRQAAAAVMAVVVILVLVGIGYFLARKTPVASVPATVSGRRSVAVLGFKNLSGRADTAWLSTALAEMLTTELAAGEKLLTVSGENVARVKNDLALPETDSLAADTLKRVRKNLGSDYVILGSYLDLGGGPESEVRLDLRIQDAVSGQTIASFSEKGIESQLDSLLTHAGSSLRQKLGIEEAASSEEVAVKASLPSNLSAARFYAEGLAKLRAYDSLGARDLFLKAVAADPQHALSRSALAAAWGDLGYQAKAQEAAKQAFDLSASLPQEDRLLVEGQYYEASHQRDKAIATYQNLYQLFPDNLEYGLKLASAQISAVKGNDALATIAALRQLPPPRGEDLRLDMQEALAARSVGDFKRQQEVAGRLAERATEQGARFFIAHARMSQCIAQRNLGDPASAVKYCEQARQIAAATGDRGEEAIAINNIANSLYDRGDLPGARKMYEESARINRQIGNMGVLAGALDNIASVLGDQGDLIAANHYSQQALAIYREIDDKMGIGETLNNIAAAQVQAGNLSSAQKIFQEVLGIWREAGLASGTATVQTNLGDLYLSLGDIPASRRAYQEAFDDFNKNGEKTKSSYPLIGLGDAALAAGDLSSAEKYYSDGLAITREAGEKHESVIALSGLAEILKWRDDLPGAVQRLEEALRTSNELGEKQGAADNLRQLAQVSLEQGKPGDAEASARKAVQSARESKIPESEGTARTTLAMALLEEGKSGEAQQQLALAKGLLAKSERLQSKLAWQIASARVQAALGNSHQAAAVAALSAAAEQANHLGFLSLNFEARLALGIAELKAGDADRGRASLLALQKNAEGKGFPLIVRKAAAAVR